MLELEYKQYLTDNSIYEENYLLMTPNTLLESIKDSIILYGLVLELNDAIAIELYKKASILELKKIINSISAENPTIFKNLNGRFNLDILPAIEPVDQKTQAYNVIIEDLSNILAIEENNRKNIFEKNKYRSDRDA